jgi:hypothetical protein
LIRIQEIVHFPKTILSAGTFSRFRRCFGMRMYLRERKVSKDKPQAVAHNLLNFFHDQVRGATIGTFKIPVLD